MTDIAAPPIRATRDVDVITEVASVADYHRLSKQLRERGFTEDQNPEAPICRWKTNGVLLDVMPTNPDILGWGRNAWYQPALEAAEFVDLPSGKRIRMVTAPYFLATKLAAFDGRGKGDYLAYDIEDIVAVLDGRPEVIDEVQGSSGDLRSHLAERFRALLDDARFVEAVSGHIPDDASGPARVPIVIERIQSIAELV